MDAEVTGNVGPIGVAVHGIGTVGRLALPAARQRIHARGVLLESGTPWLDGATWLCRDGVSLCESIVARHHRLGLWGHADDVAVAWPWQAIRNTDQRADLEPAATLGAWCRKLPAVGHRVLEQAAPALEDEIRNLARRVPSPVA